MLRDGKMVSFIFWLIYKICYLILVMLWYCLLMIRGNKIGIKVFLFLGEKNEVLKDV